MRVLWAMVAAASWCLRSLASLAGGLFPLALATTIALAWTGVALTRGRNWFVVIAAIGITASFIPVIRRERSLRRSAQPDRRTPPSTTER